MRILLTILLSIITIFGFGQSVTAPDPKSFTLNTTAQDASGFSLSGFSSSATLLCAIGLPTAPTGTTFYMSTTTGLTPATGYTMSGNKTRLAFTGTMANINAALATLKVNTTATAGSVQISVSATVNPTGYYYNPSNGHFYRPINVTATYPNAKTLSSQQTFKGQTGYLVTLTSSDEENFVILNVPQNNIWIALTDEVVEAQWRIDAGPEAGTLIKTSNGQTAGNIQGQYNNWCGGEPNNSGNEDYAVTKWGGGSCWNDLPANFSNPYIVEFGTWTNPDNQTFTDFYSNSVSHSNGNVFRVQYSFGFTNIDETQFKIRTKSFSNNIWTPFSQTYSALNGVGRVDMSSLTDTVKLGDGKKGNIVAGGAEWSYVNISNGVTTLYIDLRKFDANTQPSDVKTVSILDVYDGPVTYDQTSLYWAHYIVPSTLPKVTNGTSTFVANIRNAGYNNWAFTCEVSFTNNNILKKQGIEFQSPIQDTLNALLDRAVTVSDVYLAFREFADGGGIFGGGSGTQFTSGVQFMNGDVNGDGQFNEADCFRLLQHLTGQKALLDTVKLSSFMKLLPTSTYNTITKTNWQTFSNVTSNEYLNLDLTNTTSLNTFGFNVFWKGDVNLSHSPTPSVGATANNSVNSISSMAVKTMSTSNLPTAYFISEIIGDSLVLTLNTKAIELTGLQFRINYDNTFLKFVETKYKTSGSPTNFSADRGSYINLGSLLTSGETLGNTEYRLVFTTKQKLENSLGLVSIASNEGVDKIGNTIKIKVE